MDFSDSRFPEGYENLVRSRELRYRGGPYKDPLETGYLLDIMWQSQFSAVMQNQQPIIISEGEKYGFDPRALAGAMQWEYVENPKGWIWDSVQIGPLGRLKDNPGLGFGSMHSNVVENFFPDWDFATGAKARMYIDTAVPLMAAWMDQQATRFETGLNTYLAGLGRNERVNVRDNPAMLTWLYNTSEKSIDISVKTQRANLSEQIKYGKPLSLQLNIYENRLGKSGIGMGPWVDKNINQFSSYASTKSFAEKNQIPLVFTH
jgi:hypothetical protein